MANWKRLERKAACALGGKLISRGGEIVVIRLADFKRLFAETKGL
jgi:hypothetical protein